MSPTPKEVEFTPVPVPEQLDRDEGEGADALEGGDDTEDLDSYRDRSGPIWEGPE